MKFTLALVLALAAVVSCDEAPKKIEKRGILGLGLGYGLGAPLAAPLAAPIAAPLLHAPIAPLGLGYGSPLLASGYPLAHGLPLASPLGYGLASPLGYGLGAYGGLPLGYPGLL